MRIELTVQLAHQVRVERGHRLVLEQAKGLPHGVHIANFQGDIRVEILGLDTLEHGPGQDLALANDGGSAKVAVSELVGGIQSSDNLQCFDNYDENMAAVNCRSGTNK